MRSNACRYWWMSAKTSNLTRLYWICGCWYRRSRLRRTVWGTSSRRHLKIIWSLVVAISMCWLIALATQSPKLSRPSSPIAKTTRPQSSSGKTSSLKTISQPSSHPSNHHSNHNSTRRCRNTNPSLFKTWSKKPL
jgi:hypothetical protein